MGPDDPFPGRRSGSRVTLAGTWVPSRTLFVSGRERDGVDGYWVVTPVAVGGPDAAALPVVRGGLRPAGRHCPADGERVRLDAWLQPPRAPARSTTTPATTCSRSLRIADVIQHVDQDLYGAYGVAEEPGPGLEQASPEQLPDVGALTSIRNLLYAVEWWFFGASPRSSGGGG